MNLAIIFGIYLLGVGCPSKTPGLMLPSLAWQNQDNSASQQPQASTPQSKSSESAPTAHASSGQAPAQVRPSGTRNRRQKKTANCSKAPTALNTSVAGSNSARAGTSGSTQQVLTGAGATNSNQATLPPCPPPKKVIRNGGSDEPTVQLRGGTEQTWQQRSTDELASATNENLKKIAGRQLNTSQQEMVTQIKQFMEQSQAAVAAGDLQRGHELAAKAHLLSNELVKP
jgi:hypothetical protein